MSQIDDATARELSDAECDAIFYARAYAISRGERTGGDGFLRDRDLIREGYRAGAASRGGQGREPTRKTVIEECWNELHRVAQYEAAKYIKAMYDAAKPRKAAK